MVSLACVPAVINHCRFGQHLSVNVTGKCPKRPKSPPPRKPRKLPPGVKLTPPPPGHLLEGGR